MQTQPWRQGSVSCRLRHGMSPLAAYAIAQAKFCEAGDQTFEAYPHPSQFPG